MQGLQMELVEHFCTTFRTVLTDWTRRAVPRRQLSFLSENKVCDRESYTASKPNKQKLTGDVIN